MLTLFLIRHAKSSWDEPGLSDKDRPLNKRGKKDAPMMGRILAEKNEIPELIYASTAERAYKTAAAIAEETGYKTSKIKKENSLYMAGTADFNNIISGTENKFKKIMVFSHNYGITDYANHLTNAGIENIPTCGVVKINFDFNDWVNIINQKGKMDYFIYPKMFK